MHEIVQASDRLSQRREAAFGVASVSVSGWSERTGYVRSDEAPESAFSREQLARSRAELVQVELTSRNIARERFGSREGKAIERTTAGFRVVSSRE